MTDAEQEFVNQLTRSLMVEWAEYQIETGRSPKEHASFKEPYVTHARSKGWLSKKEPPMLLASGFGVAASFLKR